MIDWDVSENESGSRLLSFLKKHLPKYSARQLKEAIERGLCLINHRVERFASTSLGYGDKVSFFLERLEESSQTICVDESRVLYVDEDMVVYDKPSGIVSDDPRFVKALQKLFSGIELVHRLDKDTTGTLMFARNPEAHHRLTSLFKERKISKTYLAIVDGFPKKNSGVIEDFLGKLHTYQGQTIWGKVAKGVFAKTSWKLQKKGNHASLLLCYPETGRTHQIRVHMNGMGHPILGDHQYSQQFECSYRPQRCLLHAWEISFEHPQNKQTICVKAPIPPDFLEAMNSLFDGDQGMP